MADDSLLKDLYSHLSDQNLIDKFFNENSNLSTEAEAILKEEIKRRNLNFQQLEQNNIAKQHSVQKYNQFKTTITGSDLLLFINDVINDKKNNKSNNEIIENMAAQGIEKDIALNIIADAKHKCIEVLDSIWGDLFWGAVILICATLLLVVCYNFSSGTIIYLPFGAIAYGLVKLGNGLIQLPNRKIFKEIASRF